MRGVRKAGSNFHAHGKDIERCVQSKSHIADSGVSSCCGYHHVKDSLDADTESAEHDVIHSRASLR